MFHATTTRIDANTAIGIFAASGAKASTGNLLQTTPQSTLNTPILSSERQTPHHQQETKSNVGTTVATEHKELHARIEVIPDEHLSVFGGTASNAGSVNPQSQEGAHLFAQQIKLTLLFQTKALEDKV